MADKSKGGRPPTPPEKKELPLAFSVQPDLHAYLSKLAETRFVAPSADQMARHILIEAAEERRKQKYLGVDFDPSSRRD